MPRFTAIRDPSVDLQGTVSGGTAALGLTNEFVKFELEAAVKGDAVTPSAAALALDRIIRTKLIHENRRLQHDMMTAHVAAKPEPFACGAERGGRSLRGAMKLFGRTRRSRGPHGA